MAAQIQLRRGLAVEWQTVNPILAEGEMGLNLNSKAIKLGDGVTHWNDLPYCDFGGSNTFIHDQTAASALWIINHGLGMFPSVVVIDSAGTIVVGDVSYIDDNTIHISFTGEFSGKAYLN